MADPPVPYVPSYGAIARALNKIKEAPTPDRFTQDFLSTKLGLKGGSPKPVIPFLKRSGFLASDGTPTHLYRRFRNPSESGAAGADALKQGYRALYEVNEYAHELKDADLKGLVVQVTGLERESGTTKAIIGPFKTLRDFADFDAVSPPETSVEAASELAEVVPGNGTPDQLGDIKLAYTINLNLPPTSDIAVFNAIFKSLRDHLLR